jgi:ubiquinone/menaquinone biosynthesis C-methylase UbiE
LWLSNYEKVPKAVHIILSDISEGMIRDTRRAICATDSRFEFNVFDCHHIPYEAEAFDLVIANHVLFYCDDLKSVCKEISRVLKEGGTFLCSTYGQNHMKEISQLVSDFDNRIVLSADKLYERFGKDNGASILSPYFNQCTWLQYEDFLHVTEPEPLISYVLSCHGNQNQYIIDRYKEFHSYVKKKTTNGFHITKDAGLFILKK